MQSLIESIQKAIADGATPEQKQAGAVACRAILAALEAKPGTPLTAAPDAPTSLMQTLAKLEPHQALDLVIARLRAAVPNAVTPEAARGFNVPLLTVPRSGGVK